jgi:hypothetical protein
MSPRQKPAKSGSATSMPPPAAGALCLEMESVGLRLGGVLCSVGATQFGFSWLVAVSRQRPTIMRVGIPWNSLDSLVRIGTFQWVTRRSAEIFFHPLLSCRQNPGAGKPTIWRAEGTDCSWGKLNSVSDFLQDISTRSEARE